MDTICQISGDRLTLHLPADMREALGFQDGSPVTVDLVRGALVIRPQTSTGGTLNESPADVAPEAPGGDLGRNRDAEEEMPSPSDNALLVQITGLGRTQLQAVVHQRAGALPTISHQQIATNLAALLGVPVPDVLPALGLRELDSAQVALPPHLLLDRVAHVLDLFVTIRAVLGHEHAAHWFSQPNRHLGDLRPLELCRTPEGQARLRDHLDGLLSGNVL